MIEQSKLHAHISLANLAKAAAELSSNAQCTPRYQRGIVRSVRVDDVLGIRWVTRTIVTWGEKVTSMAPVAAPPTPQLFRCPKPTRMRRKHDIPKHRID